MQRLTIYVLHRFDYISSFEVEFEVTAIKIFFVSICFLSQYFISQYPHIAQNCAHDVIGIVLPILFKLIEIHVRRAVGRGYSEFHLYICVCIYVFICVCVLRLLAKQKTIRPEIWYTYSPWPYLKRVFLSFRKNHRGGR